MKKTITSAILFIVINMAFINGSSAQNRNCDKKESSDDICPIKINGVQVFDRCFGNLPLNDKDNPVGDAACNALRNANRVKSQVEKSVQSQIGDLKEDMDQFIKVVGKDAVNQDALVKYREANKLMKQIEDELTDLLKDPKFGVNGSIKKLQAFFIAQSKNLMAAGTIAASFGDAAKEVLPVVAEGTKIINEINKISQSLNNAGPEAKKQLEILKASTQAIVNDLKKVAGLNLQDIVASGTGMVATVAPFTANCAACAGVITASIASIGSGATAGTAGAVACPESAGISCIVTAAGGVLAGAGTALGTIAADPICQQAANGALKMEEYGKSISKFVNAVSSLTNDIQENIERTDAAIEALKKLAKELKNEQKESVSNIVVSMNKIADNLEDGFKILQLKTIPAINTLSNSLLSQLSVNTKELVDCYKKYSATAGIVTNDAVSAAASLATAYATLLDGKKIFDNIITQSKAGIDKAGDYIKDNRRTLDAKANTLNKSLFGVNIGQVDLGKTVETLKNIATGSNPVKFLNDKAAEAVDLVKDYTGLVANALTEGKKSFLNLDRATINCKKKTEEALPFIAQASKKLEAIAAAQKTKKTFVGTFVITEATLLLPQIKAPKKIVRAVVN